MTRCPLVSGTVPVFGYLSWKTFSSHIFGIMSPSVERLVTLIQSILIDTYQPFGNVVYINILRQVGLQTHKKCCLQTWKTHTHTLSPHKHRVRGQMTETHGCDKLPLCLFLQSVLMRTKKMTVTMMRVKITSTGSCVVRSLKLSKL